MDVNSREVQWGRATSQVNEEVSKHMYLLEFLDALAENATSHCYSLP